MAHTDPLLTYCATLRSALEHLVSALDYGPLAVQGTLAQDLHHELKAAHSALAMDKVGLRAAAEMSLHYEVAALAYHMANYLHWDIYGTPRDPHDTRPTVAEMQQALTKLAVLTATAAAGVGS